MRAIGTDQCSIAGTLEARPPHVRIAATSNRRHLIAERRAENSESDALHTGQTTDETLSLAILEKIKKNL